MTPAFQTEGGRMAPTLGVDQAGDRGGVAVLDEDGVVLFTGHAMDAVAFMATHGLVEHWDCEIIENRAYTVGLEPF